MPDAAPVIVGAKIDPLLKEQLVEQARENERNVSQEIRLALRHHVDAHRALALAAAGHTAGESAAATPTE